MLRYRLAYAEKGIPTSPADVANKKPELTGWQEKATADPRQIHMESNRWPDSGILMPMGTRGGQWMLDFDTLEDLSRLEEDLGVRLRGTTT